MGSMMNVLAQLTLCCSCSLQSLGTSSARPVFPMTLLQRMEVYAAGDFQPPKEFPTGGGGQGRGSLGLPLGFVSSLALLPLNINLFKKKHMKMY